MSRVRRVDLAGGEALAKPVQLPNGTWVLEGFATRAGVLRYLNADGTERLEFRPPEEVQKAAANLALCVLTLNHPPEGYVTPATVGKHQRGTVLEARWDGDSLRMPVRLHVTDQRLLDALAADTKELSPGYAATVTEESGEWQGQRYTHVQRDIEHNHLAVVKHGRAGAGCALRLDAEGNVSAESLPRIPVPPIDTPAVPPSNVGSRNTAPSPEGKEKPMEVEVEIDGKVFKVPAPLAELINSLKAKAAEKNAAAETMKVELDTKAGEVTELKADKADLQKDKATLKSRVDAAEAKAKELEVKLASETAELEKVKKMHADAADPTKVAEAVKSRVALITRATPVLGTKYDFDKASSFTVHCDALEKLVGDKPELKKMLDGFKSAKDEAGAAILFNVEMVRFDSDGGRLGTPHGPANESTENAFVKAQKQLIEKQRKPA